jgi:hypothetical protein
MGLFECICGYGVAPTADDRIAKAMQTFNLKARSRRPVVSRRHRRDSWPSHFHESGFFPEFEPFRGASERPRCHAARRKKI